MRIIAVLVLMCTLVSASELQKFRFLPHWYPQAEFAGYFMAKELGIYQKYGLDVEIIEGSPEKSPVEFLESGKADFVSMLLVSGIRHRTRRIDLVNIAQLVQRSSMLIVTMKDKGISSFKDLSGKRVGIWTCDLDIPVRALFERNQVQAQIVPVLSSVNIFLFGGVEAVNVTKYNEYHKLLNSGYDPDDLTIFNLGAMGLDFPEDGIYCSSKLLTENRQASCSFVKATLEGWQQAFKNPEKAVEICIDYIRKMKDSRQPASRVHQKWMLEEMRKLMTEGDAIPATLSGESYKSLSELMLSQGSIDHIPEFDDFHDSECISHAEE